MKRPLLDRVKERQAQNLKAFTESPFWSLDRMRTPFYVGGLGDTERIANDFVGYVEGAYKRNGAVFACMAARQMAFSEARFQWRRFKDGRPSELFGSTELALLEKPWPGGTTGELLSHMIQDADLAGNAFITITDDNGRYGKSAAGPGRRLVRMRPDWVEIILGSLSGDLKALDTRVILYRYNPPGPDAPAVDLLPDEVAHFSPIPDPDARFRGMSWLTPVLREIESDTLAATHKKKFFENAAVPNMAVKFDKETGEDEFDEFVAQFKENHQGAMNAYRTVFLLGGADVVPLTMDFKALDFTGIVGKGESRIASAAGVPGSIVGFSEGLQGSGLNSQGVYAAARRRFADVTIRPMWRMAAASLETLLEVPTNGAHLWFDTRDIAFLREDDKDRAEIFNTDVATLSSGIMQGFEPDAMIEATRDYDIGKLIGRHTGLVSVQMQSTRVPDESVDRQREELELLEQQAKIVAVLVSQGQCTVASAVAAVESGDLSLLEKAPLPKPQPGAPPRPAGNRDEQQAPAPARTDNDQEPGGGT
ncbi:phage portal protein [Streptomyces sp. NPDC015131]|uniref:phage portal protein n=1 Tax=Streptomyces sp. NPDC015131 TaxID=3364941 RepID=UPI0037020E54